MRNFKIQDVNHKTDHMGRRKNRYCGPSAVSAITGAPTGHIAAMIRERFNRKMITGTGSDEVLTVLEDLGYTATREWYAIGGGEYEDVFYPWPRDAERRSNDSKQYARQAPTLAAWLKQTRERRHATKAAYLVVAGWHWAVVQGDRYVCGLTECVVPTKKAPGRRSRVVQAFEVEPKF